MIIIDKHELCPMCGYPIEECECKKYSEYYKNSDNELVVAEHLYLLSGKQLSHLVGLERFWDKHYTDSETNKLTQNLLMYGTTLVKNTDYIENIRILQEAGLGLEGAKSVANYFKDNNYRISGVIEIEQSH